MRIPHLVIFTLYAYHLLAQVFLLMQLTQMFIIVAVILHPFGLKHKSKDHGHTLLYTNDKESMAK